MGLNRCWMPEPQRTNAAKGLLEEMYRNIILEHYQRPRNRRVLERPSVSLSARNPSCGDELELQLRIADDVIEEVTFTGSGCAISTASASLMTQTIKGKTIDQALELAAKFHAMLRGEPPAPELGDLLALSGVSKLHARIKCATLAWQTLETALTEAQEPTSGQQIPSDQYR
jgi:nitrogen fixation protein NifU and related proteins